MHTQLGVIFDMDGVLVDSTEAHFQAFKSFGEGIGAPFTMEFFRKIFGLHNDAIFPLWLGPKVTPAQVKEYAAQKEALYRSLAPEFVKPLDGVIDLIDALSSEGFRLAVGSSGPRENVELALDLLGRRNAFTATVSGSDVTHGKPRPDIFLKATGLIGMEPSECAVIEDALAGIEAAQAAKIAVIAVASSLPFSQIQHANLAINSLCELTPARIRNLIQQGH